MLDRVSELVLSRIIAKCKGNPECEVEIGEADFPFSKLSINLIYSVCKDLYLKGYLSKHYPLYEHEVSFTVYLTYKGYSYFEYKKIDRKQYFKQFFLSKTSDILVSIIVTIIINLLL